MKCLCLWVHGCWWIPTKICGSTFAGEYAFRWVCDMIRCIGFRQKKKKKRKKENCCVALKWNIWIFGSIGRKSNLLFLIIFFLQSTRSTKFGCIFYLFSLKRWKNIQFEKILMHSRPQFLLSYFFEIGRLLRATQHFFFLALCTNSIMITKNPWRYMLMVCHSQLNLIKMWMLHAMVVWWHNSNQ